MYNNYSSREKIIFLVTLTKFRLCEESFSSTPPDEREWPRIIKGMYGAASLITVSNHRIYPKSSWRTFGVQPCRTFFKTRVPSYERVVRAAINGRTPPTRQAVKIMVGSSYMVGRPSVHPSVHPFVGSLTALQGDTVFFSSVLLVRSPARSQANQFPLKVRLKLISSCFRP